MPSKTSATCSTGSASSRSRRFSRRHYRRLVRRLHVAGDDESLFRPTQGRHRHRGISNFLTFLQNTPSYRRDLRRVRYGDERDSTMREFFKTVSPLTQADRIEVPILVVNGQNDPRVPASESDQVVAEVKKNGVPVWYIVGKNEGHGFAKKPSQDYLQAAKVLFLKRFLLGGERR